MPTLQPQEISPDHPDSTKRFQPRVEKPFVATAATIAMYSQETILACLNGLRSQATLHQGLDYLQVFPDDTKAEHLWFIEDRPGGAITALLPSDY